MFCVAKRNSAEFVGIIFVSIEAAERNDLIAAYTSGFVDFHGIQAFEHDMALGADHKECGGQIDFVESLEIQISAVHDVEHAGFED